MQTQKKQSEYFALRASKFLSENVGYSKKQLRGIPTRYTAQQKIRSESEKLCGSVPDEADRKSAKDIKTADENERIILARRLSQKESDKRIFLIIYIRVLTPKKAKPSSGYVSEASALPAYAKKDSLPDDVSRANPRGYAI